MSFLAQKYNCHIVTGTYYEKRSDGIYNSLSIIDSNGEILGTSSKKDLVGFEKALKIKSQLVPVVIETARGAPSSPSDHCIQLQCMFFFPALLCMAPALGWHVPSRSY